VRYWPHPAEISLIREPTEILHNIINIFSDGSKIGGKVGAAAVIIKDDNIVHQSKFRLRTRCSNNQAEQVAVLKAREQIKSLQLKEDEEKKSVVNTDSKVTLDTLKNRDKHSILTDNIRNEIKRLEELGWTVLFNWVKAHTGIQGN
jgi:ribonuclease HI